MQAGPIRLAAALGLVPSTVGAVIRRESLPLLADIDRITGEVIRASSRRSNVRYEHREPGSLLHIDVKKLGRIPDGGGWRVLGREGLPHGTGQGWDYVHVAVDDHSRLAYVEILPDETGDTCAQFLHRAAGWFRKLGVIIRRVQRDGLPPQHHLGGGLLSAADQATVHQARLPLDQRQSRASQPHPANRMGLLQSLDQQHRTRRSACPLARPLQH